MAHILTNISGYGDPIQPKVSIREPHRLARAGTIVATIDTFAVSQHIDIEVS